MNNLSKRPYSILWTIGIDIMLKPVDSIVPQNRSVDPEVHKIYPVYLEVHKIYPVDSEVNKKKTR